MRKTQLISNLKAELEAVKALDPNMPIADQLNLISATLCSAEELVELTEAELKLAS